MDDQSSSSSFRGRQSARLRKEMEMLKEGKDPLEDCLSCRIMAGGIVSGMGVYLGYAALMTYRRGKTNKIGYFLQTVFASGIMSLGMMNMIGYYPFRPKK